MSGNGVLWFVAVSGAVSTVYGLYAMSRPAEVARRNAAFIDSGKEAYFEQRRSWKAYGTMPPRDAAGVRRAGLKELIAGLVMLAAAFIFHFIAQG